MRLLVTLRHSARTAERVLELPSSATFEQAAQGKVRFVLDGRGAEADWAETSPGLYSLLVEGRSYQVHVTRDKVQGTQGPYRVTLGDREYFVELKDPRRQRYSGAPVGLEGPQEVLAPMPGKIVKILVAENQQVEAGAGLVVIEAMKMQNELPASRAGCVEKIYVQEGTGVEAGSKLLRLA